MFQNKKNYPIKYWNFGWFDTKKNDFINEWVSYLFSYIPYIKGKKNILTKFVYNIDITKRSGGEVKMMCLMRVGMTLLNWNIICETYFSILLKGNDFSF